jgi:hypothetical protein
VLGDLEVGALTRIMRPTLLTAGIVGVIAFGIALLLGSAPAAVGIVLGLAAAVLNVRMLASGVTRVETDGTDTDNGKVVRRILRTRSTVRLVAVTVVAIALVLVAPPFGIGFVVGLVIFQIAFVLNAGRAILSAGIG